MFCSTLLSIESRYIHQYGYLLCFKFFHHYAEYIVAQSIGKAEIYFFFLLFFFASFEYFISVLFCFVFISLSVSKYVFYTVNLQLICMSFEYGNVYFVLYLIECKRRVFTKDRHLKELNREMV